MLRVKSVHSPIERKADGLRILVARFRGRGLESSRYDVWMASLGPSEQLLRQAQSGEITWAAFAREYRKELKAPGGEVDARCKTIRNNGQTFTLRLIKHLAHEGNVTLMCHCAEDATQCHRFLLRDYIEKI